MSLPPLEYVDCFVDAPNFRDIIAQYEKELEANSAYVKSLVKECRNMISATEEFSKAQIAFAQALGSFTFQTIGEQTEDEKMIINFLQTASRLLFGIEDFRHNMISTISVRLLQNLENFRNEEIKKAKDEKKKFDRASQSYYASLERHLSTNPKKKEAVLAEADSAIEVEHANYRQAAFQYVCKLQDVHSQKKYELVEPIIGYIGDVSTFLHQAYDNALSIRPEQEAVQFKVQVLRETHEKEQEKQYQLKARIIEDGEAGMVQHPEFFRQGHLYVQDTTKKTVFTAWHKYFCQFRKEEIGGKKIKQVRFVPIGHSGLIPTTDFIEVKNCVRTKHDEADRRFCFEVEVVTPQGNKTYTCQGISQDDRKQWLEIMEGKEPVYTNIKVLSAGGTPDMCGYDFVSKCIAVIEDRGLEEEGLYRKPGVLSKANKLHKDGLEKNKLDQIDFSDEFELDTKTIASAVKSYFGKHLTEPLLTFTHHFAFVDAGKINDRDRRVERIKELIGQIPEENRNILRVLIQHLSRVAKESDRNLMKTSNLGVVFGPTLMRPERESVAAIMDIKYQNIVVEEMIEHVDMIFASAKVPISKTPTGSKPRAATNAPPLPSRGEAGDTASNRRVPPPVPGGPATPTDTVPPALPKEKPRRPSESSGKKRSFTEANHRPPNRAGSKPTVSAKPALDPSGVPSRPSRKPRSQGKSARALYNCSAEDDLELSFQKDEILHNVFESEEPDWLRATRSDGKKGLVPANYVEILP